MLNSLEQIPRTLQISILFSLVLFTSCSETRYEYIESLYGSANYDSFAYDLAKPDTSFSLHYDLTEISGLAYHPENKLLAIQDEKGILYILNPETGEINKRVRFGNNGDYEGVEIIFDTVYVLKSNGNIYHFPYSEEDEVENTKMKTPLNKINNCEGLGFNQLKKGILIACKGHPFPKGKESADGRSVFRIKYKTKKFKKEPFFNISEVQLKEWVDQNSINHKKLIQFRPSGIAVHPHTNDFYILSNIGRIIVVLSPDRKIKGVYPLNPIKFRQPEGICFNPEGKMFISNEGKGRRGTIVVYSMKDTLNSNEQAD